MKVILMQDVPNVGHKYEIKEVRNGYARNFLLRHGLAREANDKAIKHLENEKKKAEETKLKEATFFESTMKELKGKTIIIEAKTTEKGGLFRKITAKEIIKTLEKEKISGLSENDIILNEPIKQTGEHAVEIKHGDSIGSITLSIRAK